MIQKLCGTSPVAVNTCTPFPFSWHQCISDNGSQCFDCMGKQTQPASPLRACLVSSSMKLHGLGESTEGRSYSKSPMTERPLRFSPSTPFINLATTAGNQYPCTFFFPLRLRAYLDNQNISKQTLQLLGKRRDISSPSFPAGDEILPKKSQSWRRHQLSAICPWQTRLEINASRWQLSKLKWVWPERREGSSILWLRAVQHSLRLWSEYNDNFTPRVEGFRLLIRLLLWRQMWTAGSSHQAEDH